MNKNCPLIDDLLLKKENDFSQQTVELPEATSPNQHLNHGLFHPFQSGAQAFKDFTPYRKSVESSGVLGLQPGTQWIRTSFFATKMAGTIFRTHLLLDWTLLAVGLTYFHIGFTT